MYRSRIWALVFTSLPFICLAQTPDTAAISKRNAEVEAYNAQFYGRIEASAFYTGKEIRLRWAPDAAGAWLNGNGKGYVVQRIDLGAPNDSTFEIGSWEPVGSDSLIKQLSIPEWQALSETYADDEYIMLAGGMIAAAHEEKNIGFDPDLVTAAQELEQRFSFTLLAADLSYNAAMGAALGVSDKNIIAGHNYMYRVYLPTLENYPVDTGYAFISADQPSERYEPLIQRVDEHERGVALVWEREAHQKRFTAYTIERSEDGGKTFSKLNEKPFVSFTNPDLPGQEEYIVYTDTLNEQYKPYQYRVTGLNMFGLESRASRVVKGMARDKTAPPAPDHVHAEEKVAGEITITWQYPDQEPDLDGFYVLRGDGAYGEYVELNTEPLPASTRTFVDNSPVQHAQNYYLVLAVDTAKNAGISMSAWGLLTDSIPPAAPTGVEGTLDSTGVVNLSWDLGPEKDVFGYYVFMFNQSDHVGARITPYPIRDTTFIDTVSMRTLTEEVYYEVVALDMAKNNSLPSQKVELKRPDMIAPEAPLLVDYRVTEEGIWIKWANSNSYDLEEQVLLRRTSADATWDTIQRYEPTIEPYTTYTQKDKGERERFEYTVLARDDDGLWSSMANSFHLQTLSDGRLVAVKKLNARLDRDKKVIVLNWDYKQDKDIQFVVLKSNDGDKFQRVKLLTATDRDWTDRLVKEGQEYSYYIQVVDPNGPDSNYSPQAKVKL